MFDVNDSRRPPCALPLCSAFPRSIAHRVSCVPAAHDISRTWSGWARLGKPRLWIMSGLEVDGGACSARDVSLALDIAGPRRDCMAFCASSGTGKGAMVALGLRAKVSVRR